MPGVFRPNFRLAQFRVARSFSFSNAAPAGISGTLSATLGALTSSATGAVLLQGAASPTLAALTTTATGTIIIKGAASPTLGALTSAATGTVVLKGALSATLGDVTLSAAASAPIVGTVAATLDPLTASSTGSLLLQASASITLAKLHVAITSAGTLKIAGAVSVTLEDLTATSTAEGAGTVAHLHGKRRLSTWGRGKRVIYPDEIDPPCVEPECAPEPEPEPEPEAPFAPIDPAPIVAEALEASGATFTRLVTESRRARKVRETQIAAEKAAHRARLAQDDEYLLLTA